MQQFSLKSWNGKLILLATILASGMAFLDGTVVNIAIPTIQTKLSASFSDMQWILNGYTLVLCALILIGGALGDRFGKKKIFLTGIFLFTFCSFLCGVSQTTTQLIFFRFLQGIGAALMIPGSLSIINASFMEKQRGSAIGLWSGFAGGVAALGPFLGGWLVQTLSWQSIFYINIPIGIFAIFVTMRFVPGAHDLVKRKIDFKGTLLVFLGLLGVTYALISGPEFGWTSAHILATFIAGIVFCVLFVVVEMREKEPMVPLAIFKSPLVTGANLATLFLYFALSGVIFFFVLNLQQVQHFSPINAGLSMLPAILLITFLSGPAGTLADKIGPRTPMIAGPLIVAVGMTSLMIPGTHANYFTGFLPGLVLFGGGMALVIAPLTKSALAVKSDISGAASGINNAVSRIAGLLAVALLGAIVLSLFSIKLNQNLSKLSLNNVQTAQILQQKNKLAAVEIPQNFDGQTKIAAQNAIEESFVYGFRVAMGICAFLALLSAIASYKLITNKKK